MKKTIIALMALAGVAAADSTPLTVLNDTYGTLIGGYNSNDKTNGTNANAAGTNFTLNYSSMSEILTKSGEWYVSSWNENVGGFTYDNTGIIVVAGGPKTPSADGVGRSCRGFVCIILSLTRQMLLVYFL